MTVVLTKSIEKVEYAGGAVTASRVGVSRYKRTC